MPERKKPQTLSKSESERLVAENTPMVKAIAHSLLRKLPGNVELDDLVQNGFIGLLSAIIQTTKERAGAQFQKYLSQRVRGAMLDGLRENDPGTRAIRRAMRQVEHSIHELGHRFGRSPTEEEVALSLAMPLHDYQRVLQEAYGYTLFSIEDFDDGNSEEGFLEWCVITQSDPVAALERRELQRKLLTAIGTLSSRETEVMTFLHMEDMTMRSIGERLKLTEGRISQIRTQAIAKLRAAVMGVEDRPSLLAPRRRVATTETR